MSENWSVQVSPKLPDGTLVNLRADSPEQMNTLLGWASQNAGIIEQALTALRNTNGAAVALGASSVTVEQQAAPTGWQTPPTAPPPAWAGQQQPQNVVPFPQGQQAPMQPGQPAYPGNCAHGQRVYKEGTNKSGKPYKGWFCGSNVQGCSPEWVR